jgi:hypothetical protein
MIDFEKRAARAFAFAAGLACALGMALPASAAEGDAQKLRRMDIMLMVTALRCRTGVDNFIDDYGHFTSNHMSELNEANAQLRAEFATQVGEEGAVKALDKLSVVMANQYGGGHPWLSCHELRQVTQSLALVQGRDTLVEAAGQLLERKPPVLFALAGR